MSKSQFRLILSAAQLRVSSARGLRVPCAHEGVGAQGRRTP